METIRTHWDQGDFAGCPLCDHADFERGPEGDNGVFFKCKRCGAAFEYTWGAGFDLIGWPEKSPHELRTSEGTDEAPPKGMAWLFC